MSETTNRQKGNEIGAGDADGLAETWAPKRIWLQRGVGEGGSHTWCEDSQAPEHQEASYIREDFTGALSADYLSGHQDALDWAAQMATHTDPRTSNWYYDDPHELSKAISKGPDLSHYARPAPETLGTAGVDERVAFEAWVTKHPDADGVGDPFKREADDSYEWKWIEGMWESWQGRAILAKSKGEQS